MTSLTLDALAFAAQAADALVATERALIASLTLSDPPLGALNSNCALITDILAPAMQLPADAAAIVALLSADAATIGQNATPADAAGAFYTAAQGASTALSPIVSPARGRAAGMARMMCAGIEASWLGQAFVMEAMSNFTDRQAALDARNRISAAMDDASDRIALAIGAGVFELLSQTASYATNWLVAEAADLAPVVIVDAGRSFPATALAFALYGDPQRAGELVARNASGTSLFMPAQFQALAPQQ
jgi:hypothetical protein